MTSRLFDAIRAGDLQSTRKLLEGKEDVYINIRNSMGGTPLHEACRCLRHKIAKFLLQEKKVDVNATDCHGRTPLFVMICYEKTGEQALEIVKLLLANGASANTKIPNTSETVLHRACLAGRIWLVQVLLDHGADVNARDQFGDTPFNDACIRRHANVIKLLLANNADRHIKNNNALVRLYRRADMAWLREILTSFDNTLAVSENDVQEEEVHPRRCRAPESSFKSTPTCVGLEGCDAGAKTPRARSGIPNLGISHSGGRGEDFLAVLGRVRMSWRS